MVDRTPSNNLDALFDPASVRGVDNPNPPQPVQHVSRRAAREAAMANVTSVPVATFTPSAPATERPRASVRRPKAAAVKKSLTTSEVPLVRASRPASNKRNPISVLATMLAIGGMFAVAALPAYASQETDAVTTASLKLSESSPLAQTIEVGADVSAVDAVRDGFHATTPEQLAEANDDAIRAAANEAYLASGARELGDDYPWPYELTDDNGGGLSPLNYYYRECVDFVAWRINRDQGYYQAPFKWVWSNLTPFGGNGGQWQSNWESLGRTVSKTPIAGSVAYTGGNHVAYVKSVNADGTVTLEEYNYVPGMYSQRTIPASSVVSFLYPPS